MPHWQSLSVFLAVAEEGSLSGAAKRLSLTQPTVSFHMDNLEKRIGCPLVERTAKGTALTVYGEILYETTSQADALLRTAERRLREMASGTAGKITVGASTIPAEYILPGIIASFLAGHPGLEFTMRTGDSQTVLAALAAGEFPVAVIGQPPGEGFFARPLLEDEIVLIAHPAVAARLGESPSLAAVADQPLVSRAPTSASMRTVCAELTRRGLRRDSWRPALTVGGNEALKAAVREQAGVGFISRWAVKGELAAGSLAVVPLPGLSIARRFYAVCRPPLVPACVEKFWDYLVSVG